LTPPTAFFAWIALIPLFIALKGASPKAGALLGWVFGFSQFGGILYWIGLLEAARYLSWLAWAILVLYLSAYFFFWGWIYCFLAKKIDGAFWMAPVVWVALEYIRGTRPFGGFCWGELGYSQAPYPAMLTLTELTGIYGLTFTIVFINAWLAEWIHGSYLSPVNESTAFFKKPYKLIIPLLIPVFMWFWGNEVIKKMPTEKVGTAYLLQPSVDQEIKWSKENTTATYNKLEGLIKGAKYPSLIVWPETAAPSYLLWSSYDLARVTSIVRNSKCSQLVGCLDAVKGNGSETHSFNAAIQFGPDGIPNGTYHKRHLVPFGEFVPFQKYLTFLGPVVGDLGNFDFGGRYEKFSVPGFSYCPMICYEVIFPGDVYEAFKTDADVLVNISNDAWYGRTASAYQHAMMAVVRAAEEKKPLLRSANTGICLATDPFGRIIKFTNLFEETAITVDVLLCPSKSTLFSRWGNWFPRTCWIVLAGLLIISLSMAGSSVNVKGSQSNGG